MYASIVRITQRFPHPLLRSKTLQLPRFQGGSIPVSATRLPFKIANLRAMNPGENIPDQ
jgi:hypothetical protein